MSENKGFIDKAWDTQHTLETKSQRIGKGKYGRVLKMARKPSTEEYERTSLITGAAILAVGFIGFLIYIIKELAIPAILSFF